MSSVKDRVVNSKRTICEVHREVYDLVMESVSDNKMKERVINLLEESYSYAKKMDLKLRQYKYNYDEGWWIENIKSQESLMKRSHA